jgi:hypothetical protein
MSEAVAILSISAGILLALLLYTGIAFACARLTKDEIEDLPPSHLQAILEEHEERRLEAQQKFESMKILPCAPFTCLCRGDGCCSIKAR